MENRIMIDRYKFFKKCKDYGVVKTWKQSQVSGLEHILNGWEATGWEDLRWLAYILATVTWETGYTFQPIKEKDNASRTYLRAKKYWPYYGRGYVQLTWKDNYQKMMDIYNQVNGTNLDFVKNPDLVQRPDIALFILFEGMTKGVSKKADFTGKGLEDYFNINTTDWINARKIINGTDRAKEIAKIAETYYDVLRQSLGERRIVTEEEVKEKWEFFSWIRKLLGVRE
jgi:putative chitinase